MSKNQRNIYNVIPTSVYRGIGFLLSILMVLTLIPTWAMTNVSAATKDPSFIFTDKKGRGISGIIVTLRGTNGEADVISNVSDENGTAEFFNNKPLQGSSYTYSVSTGDYLPVSRGDVITISDENEPVAMTLYASAPTGVITPQNPEVIFGDAVTFEAKATGMGELTYQWYKDENILQQKNDRALNLEGVTMADAGTYKCKVASDLAHDGDELELVSDLKVLKATPNIVIESNPVSGSRYTPEGVTFSVTVSHPSNENMDKPAGEVTLIVDEKEKEKVALSGGTAVFTPVNMDSTVIHTVSVKYSGDENYEQNEAAVSYEVGKIMPEEGVHYQTNTPNGNDGWYKEGENLQITPIGLFDQIREGQNGEWKALLEKSEDSASDGQSITFYLKNSQNGEVSKPCTIPYKLDHTAPQNQQAERNMVDGWFGKKWESEFLGNICGGGRWNSDNYGYHVTLSADDEASKVAYFQWRYNGENNWSEPVEATGGKAQINVNFNKWNTYGIEVIACDKAGNVSEGNKILPPKSLIVEYDMQGFQKYINPQKEDVAEDELAADTCLIHNQEVEVSLTAPAADFKSDAIVVKVNDEPITVEWNAEGTSYVAKFTLTEGNSVVKIEAPQYSILAGETESSVVDNTYESHVHIVDTTNPVMEVSFVSGGDAGAPFTEGRTMTVSITDKNFRTDELYFSVLKANDIQGNPIDEFDADGFLQKLKDAAWKTEGDVHTANVDFVMEANYEFTLEYKDIANNPAKAYVAEPFAVDKNPPENLKIEYISNPVSTFLQSITFGYYKPSVTIRLSADDTVSGVDCFNWTYTRQDGSSTSKNVEEKTARISCTDSENFQYGNGNRTAVATFTLTADEFSQYRGSFSFSATDKAGRTSNVHYGNGTAKNENGEEYNTDEKHVVVLDTIAPVLEVEYPEAQKETSKLYYDATCGDIVPVTLKIMEANFYPEDVKIRINEAEYTGVKWSQNNDEWTGVISLEQDGTYVITVAYTDRSGNEMQPYVSKEIVIDRQNPKVDKYSFVPAAAGGIGETADFNGNFEYGYFFKNNFTLNIHTSDENPSSGMDKVSYRLIPYENGAKKEEQAGTVSTTEGTAAVVIPNGFKGQIAAGCSDNAGNASLEVTSKGFVVDGSAPEINVTTNNTTAYKDAEGNPLYVEDISVTVTIADTLSGIREIGYAQSSENDSFARKSITLSSTGYSVGDDIGDGWIVAAMDANLVTKATKTFTYSLDDNDIILTFDAMDCAQNRNTGVSSEKFTIDKTNPVITVAFRPADSKGAYYNTNRIADITVKERNFNESLIRANIQNSFGNVPHMVFREVSKTEHVAVIDFDEGDYQFEMTGTDLGNHAATVNYSGGNERLFYVDKTKPVITDNFSEFDNHATQNSFNEDKPVSISVTEHNFSADSVALHIWKKEAGAEHNIFGMSDVTAELTKNSGWVTKGDIHTITFTVSSDAVYQIELTPVDMAGNVAEHRNSVIFEIDKTIPVVSAKNGEKVNSDATEFVDIYDYDRREEAAPTIEFSDLNMNYTKYNLTVWKADDSDSQSMPVIRPFQVYLKEDAGRTGTISGGMFTLPDFNQDGVYALEAAAVDIAGNESVVNTNTYARLVEQDVLAYILDSNVQNKTGLYSFQDEKGTPISMRPDSFSDLEIFALAKKDTPVEVVLRDANAEEIPVNTQVKTDDSIYGFTIYNFVLPSDFFKDTFSTDMDADLHLTVKNEDKRIDLGKLHIDNVAPTCTLPDGFDSWHWYVGNETRTLTISNIDELLDEEKCRVYDNGKEKEFIYSRDDNTLTFTLEKGWHSVGISLCDMAGNENNIPERVNLYVGYFWMGMIGAGTGVCGGTALLVGIRLKMKRKRMADAF